MKDPGALLMAARTGRIEVVNLLLDLGTPADVEDANGERALHAVAWADSVEVAELLLSYGADPSFKNSKGLTAADEAERKGMDALAQLLRDVQRT